MDSLLGLVLLAAYVAGMVAFAALVTYVAIRIFPTKDRSKEPKREQQDSAPAPKPDEPGQGRLYRRSKRGAT